MSVTRVRAEPRRRVDVAEAEALIGERVRDWGSVRVPLDAARGEILRQTISAERDQPPFDRVTMDGVALRHAAFAIGRRRFTLAGTQAAGGSTLILPDDGACIAVMTGAALPAGADMVVPVERTARDAGEVLIETAYEPLAGQFVHRRASDHRSGSVLLEPGASLGAPEMAILTVGGSTTVEVARRPAIAVVSTGDELVDVGQPLAANQIRASNDRAISAALASRGFTTCTRRHLPDERAVLERELDQLLAGHDVLILTGGVSMGDFDFIPQVLDELGMELVFHKVLQRPGMPLWFGVSPGGKPVFALPGNPVSSLVCLVRYVGPALLSALGMKHEASRVAKLGSTVRFEPDLACFVPVSIEYTSAGECVAWPRPTNTSGDFTALGGTAGFIELPRGPTEFRTGFVASFFAW